MNDPLARPKFDATVTLGDAVKFLVAVIAVAGTFSFFAYRVDALEIRSQEQAGEIKDLSRAGVEVGKLLTELSVDVRYLRRWAEEGKRDAP